MNYSKIIVISVIQKPLLPINIKFKTRVKKEH